jgi:UDP-hydrolysing UDP-N-acetyl-D-glucosamine 2-epimerase
MQIPLIHLQGGEISGSIDDKVRDANSKLADFHLTTNEITASRLNEMGENSELIKVVGCPSIDIVADILKQGSDIQAINSSDLGGVGADFPLSLDFGIIMFHPDTLNKKENTNWAKHLIKYTQNSAINWIWFWPNPDHGSHEISHEIRKAREFESITNIRFIVNLSPEKFVELATKAKALVGNSSFGIREASFIGLPVINLGKRQSGRQKAENVLDIPNILSFEELSQLANSHIQSEPFKQSTLYGAGNSGHLASAAILNWKPSVKVR